AAQDAPASWRRRARTRARPASGGRRRLACERPHAASERTREGPCHLRLALFYTTRPPTCTWESAAPFVRGGRVRRGRLASHSTRRQPRGGCNEHSVLESARSAEGPVGGGACRGSHGPGGRPGGQVVDGPRGAEAEGARQRHRLPSPRLHSKGPG